MGVDGEPSWVDVDGMRLRYLDTGEVAGDALPDGLSLGDECELRDPADHGGVVLASQASIAEVAAWYKDRAVADGLNTEMSIGGDVAVILRRDGTLRQLFVTVDIDDTGDTRIVLNWHREVDN